MFTTPQKRNHALWQLFVETREGKLLTVGPAMLKEASEMTLKTLQMSIASGREKVWSNPHIAEILNLP